MIVSVAGGRSDDATRSGTRIVGEGLDLASLDALVGADRPVYRHSVVAGGVYTPDELRDVLVQDAIAATHYQGLNQSAIRTETVKRDRFAYVSYRKNDQIFWTRNKVKLSEGETVLTDGNKEIRARCGNCISETPQLPVAEIEPASVEFDQLVDDSGDPFLSAAIRSALESPSFSSGGGQVGQARLEADRRRVRLRLMPVALHCGLLEAPEAVAASALQARYVLQVSRHEVHRLSTEWRNRPRAWRQTWRLSFVTWKHVHWRSRRLCSKSAIRGRLECRSGGSQWPDVECSHFRRLHFHRFRLGLQGQLSRFHLVSTHHPDSIPMPALIHPQQAISFNRWSSGWIRGSRHSIPAGAGHAASRGRGCRRRGPAKASQPSLSAVRSPACGPDIRGDARGGKSLHLRHSVRNGMTFEGRGSPGR